MRGRELLVIASVMPFCAAAQGCPPPAGYSAGDRAESEDFVVHYRADPAPIDVGQMFALEAVICAKRPGAVAAALTVDANMPEHRHGMNYRPTVAALGASRFRSDGLMFHMPGRWQLVFDIDTGKRRERVTADVVVR